jgi:hypothetical protein
MDKFIGDHKSSIWFVIGMLSVISAIIMPSSSVGLLTCLAMMILSFGMWIETSAKYWLFKRPSGHDVLSNQWLCLGAIVAISTIIRMVIDIQSLNAPIQLDSFFHIGLVVSGVLMTIGWLVQLFGYEQDSGNSQTPHSSSVAM